ncbi:MAG: nuclear transport factor 2 family protein [Sphingobium sp.]|nr:nuclear transport factor 2 family protein [Sphingobium sp.]
MTVRRLLAAVSLGLMATPLMAQTPVTGVADPEALFKDKDPLKNKNKQAALHIMRELLQCGYWSDAGNWLTQRYIQHNPNAADGLAPVQKFFANMPKAPTCTKLTTPVVAVLADGDYVTVVISRSYPDPNEPGKTYSTSWFDMWRFVDGKADEHWDPATKGARPPQTQAKPAQ